MSNMSYCRFHNTASDMQQCFEAMIEALEEGMTMAQFRESLSEDEQRGLTRVLSYAESMIEAVAEFDYNTGVERDEASENE